MIILLILGIGLIALVFVLTMDCMCQIKSRLDDYDDFFNLTKRK
jgi:hypothetical protein